MKKESSSKSCGMSEKDETPEYEAKNHPTSFLRKAVKASEKKSSKRKSKKRS